MRLETKIFGIEGVEVNMEKYMEVCNRYLVDPHRKVPMLPYGPQNIVGREIRHYYFDLARGKDGYLNSIPMLRTIGEEPILRNMQITRIFSFGECNVQCPYCKRDCQFIDNEGSVIGTAEVDLIDLFRMAESAIKKNEIVRFSGGDPIMYKNICLAISAYVKELHNTKTSIAHNGSGTLWVKQMLPFLDSAAIDLKAVPERMGKIMGITESGGRKMYERSLQTQALFSSTELNKNKAILDIRTPIFGDTSIDEMIRLGEDITKGNPQLTFWTWRLYKKVHGCDWLVPEKETVIEMLAEVSAKYPNHWMGIRAKWHGGGMLYFRNGNVVNTEEKLDVDEIIGSGNKDGCTV